MRVLSPAVQAKISQKLGTEPVNIIEVQWGGTDGPWTKYADKNIVGYEFPIDGKILSLSNLESVIKLDSQGQSQGISVTLSDSDGALKTIFDQIDIHGKRCILYQWFEGLPLSDRFQLYEGEVISPIEWAEGDRTLSFDVITKLADVEVGFSPEEGLFPYLPDNIIGKPWPLIFGTCQNVPCTLLSEIPATQTTDVIGKEDESIAEHLSELATNIRWLQGVWFFYTLCAGACAGRVTDSLWYASQSTTVEEYNFWIGEANKWEGYKEQYESASAQCASQYSQALAESSNLYSTQQDQLANSPSSVQLANGAAYPQGVQLDFEIGDLNITGVVNGNTLSFTNVTNPNYQGYTGEPFGFTFVQAGAAVRLLSVAPILYIVSITSTTILHVQAYKNTEGGRFLATVPSAYYSVATVTMGPYNVTYIKMDKPLSSYEETFENEIYATCTSSIGPNTVDILEWLITTYTNHAIDTTSFTAVKGYLENYPSHFALLERKNILTVLEEIAFQARCSIWLNNGTFYIKYLPRDYTPVATIEESNIDAGSLNITTTTTEELVTKLIARWTDNYALEEKYSLILRNNGARYGIREREVDFYIYNIGELVAKSATFWLIRMSNVWKHVSFDTYIDKMLIETFDLVTLDFTNNFIATEAVDCDILHAIYNMTTQTLSLTARAPVRCGEMVAYPFYRPQNLSVDLLFPTDSEIENGYAGSGGIGEDVEGGVEMEEFFRDAGGYNVSSSRSNRGQYQTIREASQAEDRPTDVDDEKPNQNFSTTDVAAKEEPIYDYEYGDYPIPVVEPVEEETPPLGAYCFPAKVTGKLGPNLYTADVYTRGLANDPRSEAVIQLQIEGAEEIPVDTWVLVSYNVWEETDEEGQVTRHSEYVMQVPVWL